MSDNLSGRMAIVENAVDRLEKAVGTLAGTMQKYVEQQAAAPRPIPFKEIVVTAAATLAVFSGVLTFLDNRQAKDFELVKYRIERLEKKP